MGAMAQLRQFFLDARWSHDLAERAAQGKVGRRAPYDADFDALAPLLSRKQRVVAEAETAADIERWINLADEFSFDLAISGGREAYKRAELLAQRKIPVFLTLEWGEEPDDPHAKEKDKSKDSGKEAGGERKREGGRHPNRDNGPDAKPEVRTEEKPDTDAKQEPKPDAKPDAKPDVKPEVKPDAKPDAKQDAKPETKPDTKTDAAADTKAEPKPESKPKDEWIYEEPLRVREEKRRLWEEARDGAIVLAKAGVAIHFGTGKSNPKDALEKIRGLVERGLVLDVAHAALGANEAALLGLGGRLGEIKVGAEASVAVWSADPLKAKDAKLGWLFVEGFPHEFDTKSNELQGKPDDGVDATGTWTIEIEMPDAKPVRGEFKMEKDGKLEAKLYFHYPGSDEEKEGAFEGQVAGKRFQLTGKIAFGAFESTVEFDGELDGNAISGETHWKSARRDDVRKFKGTRPKPQGGTERHRVEDDDEHPRRDR